MLNLVNIAPPPLPAASPLPAPAPQQPPPPLITRIPLPAQSLPVSPIPGIIPESSDSLLDVRLDFAVMQTDHTGLAFPISDVDQPPRPLARLNPTYPPLARLRGIEGVVQVVFTVTADGATKDIDVVDSAPGTTFVNAAVQAVRRWRFLPGMRNGDAVPVRVRQDIVFQMEQN